MEGLEGGTECESSIEAIRAFSLSISYGFYSQLPLSAEFEGRVNDIQHPSFRLHVKHPWISVRGSIANSQGQPR